MQLKFASLGSGSSGNATLVANESTCLLVDCGFGIRDTQQRLARLGLDLDAIDAILVTHEHSDHAKGAAPLARRLGVPLYMTQGTWLARDYGDVPDLQLVKNYQLFSVGEIEVQPVAVPHDAREPAQFVFRCGSLRLGILTDLGCVTSHVQQAFSACDALLLEANHDLDMLWNGPYPPSLKERVASDWGHLNNLQTADLLDLLYSARLQKVVIGHISRKNNSVDLVRQALHARCQLADPGQIIYACQDEGFDWVLLDDK